MAFTYQWKDAVELLRSYGRNIPVDKISAQICDSVSSELWGMHPWKDACQSLAPYTLLDDVQDYDSPPTFFKLVNAQIVRVVPNFWSYNPLSIITKGLPEVSDKMHPAYIRLITMEQGLGLLRLERRPYIVANEGYELHGTYQLTHTRITDMNQYVWAPDQLWSVIQEGLLYWGFKLSNNWKAAADQYKVFRGKASDAWNNEMQGAGDILVPEVRF